MDLVDDSVLVPPARTVRDTRFEPPVRIMGVDQIPGSRSGVVGPRWSRKRSVAVMCRRLGPRAMAAQRVAGARDMAGDSGRVEPHVVAGSVPGVTRVGKQVVHDIGAGVIDPERGEIEVHPARLRVGMVQVYHDHHNISAARRLSGFSSSR